MEIKRQGAALRISGFEGQRGCWAGLLAAEALSGMKAAGPRVPCRLVSKLASKSGSSAP